MKSTALLLSIVGMGLGITLPAKAQVSGDLSYSNIDSPEHDYWNRLLQDPFTKFKEEFEAGRVTIDFSNEKAFLTDLLAHLNVPASSQTLVFSTTSLQLSLISPRNPRAIYFNEDIYVGFIPGGKIEIVSIDPELGGIFYIFEIPRNGTVPEFQRSRRCMNCHSDEDSRYVPGLIIKSVIPGVRGGSLESYRRHVTGHQIPLSERFGGWYITGADDFKEHWGNAIGQFKPEGIVTTPVLPGERFDWSMFPVESSDILPHLIHDHQAGFINRTLEAHYRARTALKRGNGSLTTADREEMKQQADNLVKYLLFADEAKLPVGGLKGSDSYKKDFLASRQENDAGMSLRDFDLKTSLFSHRCSYMIYSPVFLKLPQGFKTLLYDRLAKALSLKSNDPEFAYLSNTEKANIRSILQQTHPDLKAGW